MFSAIALSCLSVATAEIIGYYSWNWGAGSHGPAGANMGAAFTGLVDVGQAISGYTSPPLPALKGTHYLTLGGGNAAGSFNAAVIRHIGNASAQIKAGGYAGVMFDVEEVTGGASELVLAFNNAISGLTKGGLHVGITTSHSAPYQTTTPQAAVALVKAWCAHKDLKIISPQLYSSGSEGAPDFGETNNCKAAGCTWSLYKGCHAAVAPSLVGVSHYAATKSFFANQGITTSGYFVWAQI